MPSLERIEELCPVGTMVRIIAPIGSVYKDWTVIPVTRKREDVEVPKGWHVLEDVGMVTHYDTEEPEAMGGKAPVVVAGYIYCALNEEIWLREEANA